VSLGQGDPIELKVTPDPYVTVRYAGASGDFNPIHVDEEYATSVGLPGRILHGLWTMAQVARAHTDAAGGPDKLRSLGVQFRGMGRMGEEIVVTLAASISYITPFEPSCLLVYGPGKYRFRDFLIAGAPLSLLLLVVLMLLGPLLWPLQ